MDLSIIEGYPDEQQTQGLSSTQVDEVIVPTADSRPPSADRRPPSADRRSPTADRRPPSAERRFPNLEENQSGGTFQDWLDDLFGAADTV